MDKISIYEVGTRDGFQSVKEYIPYEVKMEIIDKIVDAGIKHLQITSFVSPKAIPQMKDAQEIAAACRSQYPDLDLLALVPNLRGALTADTFGIDRISFVVSLSESHNKANINRSHEDSKRELDSIRNALPEMDICLDVATAFGCPFEGKKTTSELLEFIGYYVDHGIQMINLCDTIGIANPVQVREVIREIQKTFAGLDLMVHIHDTRNMGMVNTLAAIECGVNKVQSTLGGLGGCPFAPGASGNLATEDLLYMLDEIGCVTGVNLKKLKEASALQCQKIPSGSYSGHLLKVFERQDYLL